jgi:hypothetical protein
MTMTVVMTTTILLAPVMAWVFNVPPKAHGLQPVVLLGSGRTFKRQGLVGGSEVTGWHVLEGDIVVLSLLSPLSPFHEVNRFPPYHTSAQCAASP